MPRALLVAACCAAALTIVPSASGGHSRESITCIPLKAIYSEKNWRDSSPLNGRTACRPETRRGARKTIDHFRLYRRYRLVTPYPGLHEGDKWLEHLAVPAYIVLCETRGYYGQGRWRALGGGEGPYQFQGWPVPWPINSAADKVAHHEQAAELSLGNWACA